MTDLDLLRRYEPVVRYTQGEMFYPCAVDGYLGYCSLWRRNAEGADTQLLPRGAVTPASLIAHDREAGGRSLYLRFTGEPLSPTAYQQWQRSPDHPAFDSAGRLARVGIAGRLAEALFDFSLLVRGRVPGGTTGKAQQQYRQMMADDPRFVYYGRVLRDGDYTVLHYLFFYAMNDWRSSFHGVNDHESDWEQIFVYLTEEDGELLPQWVAFAAHDFSGDDLRRRWDDPELTIVDGRHVVVHAGAGSHAAYVVGGEYLMHVEPQAVTPVRRALQPASDFVAAAVSQPGVQSDAESGTNVFSLAFVDYARGDGLSIGPGQPQAWSPELVSDDVPWVAAYRGLWGLDTRDPFGGEQAPAGPKFNRDGSVRQSWYDPLGWAGLDKEPAPAVLIPETETTIASLEAEAAALTAQIDAGREQLREQGLVARALAASPDLQKQAAAGLEAVTASEEAVAALTSRRAAVLEQRRVLGDHLARLQAGDRGDPQAHLRHRAVPQPPPPSGARLMDTWAAVSGALLAGAVLALLIWRPPQWPLWIALTVLIFGMIEAGLRGKLTRYLLTSAIVLAAVALVAVTVENWRWVIPGALLFIFLFSVVNNLRELRGRRGE